MLNRILIHLDRVEAARKARQAAAEQRAEELEAITNGLIELLVDIDGTACFFIKCPKDHESLNALDEAEPILARALREFATECEAVALRLEGGEQ